MTARGDSAAGRWLLALLPVALGALANRAILGNYFFLDDFLNLYRIENFAFVRYVLTPYSDHVQPTRNAVFYLSAHLFGGAPAPYYWLAFATHLLNVWLLFRVIERLTGSARLACFGAALWAISSRHQATLGWYSVFAHALLATALLLIVDRATAAAAARHPPGRGARFLWYALALMVATTFGCGVGIAMVLPFVLALLLQGGAASGRTPPLLSLVVVVPMLYALILFTSADAPESQALRHLHQIDVARAAAVLLYAAHLVASGLATLLFGTCSDVLATRGVAYGVLATLAIGLIAAVSSARRVRSRQVAAVTLLLLACYGTIALGRGILFRDNFPIDTIWAISSTYDRYHYVGQLLLAVLLCLALEPFADALSDRVATVSLAVGLALPVLLPMRCDVRPDDHRRSREETRHLIETIQAAIDRQPPGEDVYLDNQPFAQVPLPSTSFPGWAAMFTIFFPDNTVDGHRVYFVEHDEATRVAALRGRRTKSLLVASPP